MKNILTVLALGLFLGTFAYLVLDLVAAHYRMIGAQEFTHLQSKDTRTTQPEPDSSVCLSISASVNGRIYNVSTVNICSRVIPQTELLVKFYNSQRYRIGIVDGVIIGPMETGEKTTHDYRIPPEILRQKTSPKTATAEVRK